MFENMFTQCLKHVYKIFEDILSQCCRHIYTSLEDFIIPCLTTCLHHVWRHVNTNSETCLMNQNTMYYCLHIYIIWYHVCTIYDDIFKQFFKYIYTWFADMFIKCLYTCIHQIDSIFKILLKLYLSKMDENGSYQRKWIKNYLCFVSKLTMMVQHVIFQTRI